MLEKDSHKRKCKAGDENYCPTVETHPAEVIAFTAGGLLLAGAGLFAVGEMGAAEMTAAVYNMGINTFVDYTSKTIKGESYTLQDAALTAGFSYLTGQAGGAVTKLIGNQTTNQIVKNIFAQGAVQFLGNTFHRIAKNEPTTLLSAVMELGGGAYSATTQAVLGKLMPEASTYVLSHIAEGTSSLFSAIPNHSPNPLNSVILFP